MNRLPAFAVTLCVAVVHAAAADAVLPYLRADLPVDERVADLLSRMTLQEKVNQLIIPWPGSFTAESLVADYGNTGLGKRGLRSLLGVWRCVSD